MKSQLTASSAGAEHADRLALSWQRDPMPGAAVATWAACPQQGGKRSVDPAAGPRQAQEQ